MRGSLVLLTVLTVLCALWFPAVSASGDSGRGAGIVGETVEGTPTNGGGGVGGVFVGILPMAYFVDRVGGDWVHIGVLVEPGQSPHTFEPTPKQMAELAEARAYVSIGLPFETELLKRISGLDDELDVVDASRGVGRCCIGGGHGHGNEERPDEGQPHSDAAAGHEEELDPHIWLDPKLAKIVAANISAALERLDPAHGTDYQANLAALEADLDELDTSIREALAPVAGREFLVFHPAFGYFAKAYDLKQVAVEMGGKEPSAKQLAALIDRVREAGARVVFVEPQFSVHSAETIARAIGGAVVPIDPLAYDYVGNLRHVAAELRAALSAGAK